MISQLATNHRAVESKICPWIGTFPHKIVIKMLYLFWLTY